MNYNSCRFRTNQSVACLAYFIVTAMMFSLDANAQTPTLQIAEQLGILFTSGYPSSALDDDGNLYITSRFFGTVDFDPGSGTQSLTADSYGSAFVAKYDATGAYVWAFKIGESASTNIEIGLAIAVDANANVYVTGVFKNCTVDFNPGSGTANLTAGSNGATYLAKYTSAGAYSWAFKIDNAEFNSCTIDNNGAIVVGGGLSGSVDFDPGSGKATKSGSKNGNASMFVAKYTSSGAFSWVNTILGANGSSSGSNLATIANVRTDGSNNVYISGHTNCALAITGKSSNLASSGDDMYVLRFASGGSFGWGYCIPNAYGSLVIDADDNIYVSGSMHGTADFDPGSGTANLSTSSGRALYVAKYTSAFAYTWAFVVDQTSGTSAPNNIELDGSGNVYVCGSFSGSADFDPGSGTSTLTSDPTSIPNYTPVPTNALVAKYDPDGALTWAFNITGNSGGRIATNSAGDFVVAGVFSKVDSEFDPSTSSSTLSPTNGQSFFAWYSQSTSPIQQQTTGLNELSMLKAGPSIWPNPFNSSINIDLNGMQAPLNIELLNLTGKVVESISVGQGMQSVNMGSALPTGTYVVRIQAETTQHTTVVQKSK